MAKLCECGCGQEILRRDRPCRPNRYIFGHQTKGKVSPRRNTIAGIIRQLVICEPTTLPTGCWEWPGILNNDGYGRISFQGRKKSVHAVVYEHFLGPVTEGLELDHLCQNPCCANFEHLEPVTHRINVLRGE